MITNENYEQMIIKYKQLKELVYDNSLTKEDVINHIENNTTLGTEIVTTLKQLDPSEPLEKLIFDFIEIMFPQSV